MEDTDAVDDVVEDVDDDGTVGVDAGDEVDDDIGDDEDGKIFLMSSSVACRIFAIATETDGGIGRISSKLRVCGNKPDRFVTLVRS